MKPRKVPAFSTREVSLAIRDGRTKLALVADTHSAPHPNTLALLRERRPDAILHAGDIGSLHVLDDLAAIAPTYAVRGNIDVVANDVPDEMTIDVRDEDAATLFKVYLVHIAVNGPKLRGDVARRAQSAKASIVVCGHSHVPFVGRDKGLTIMNPGSAGPRRFQLPILFGLLELKDGAVSFAHVSCETGQPWHP